MINLIQYITEKISIDKIVEITISLLVGLLFAFLIWLLKIAYEKRIKEIFLISEIEIIMVTNHAILLDYKLLLDLWVTALEAYQGYTGRFSKFNLGKDIKTIQLDLKFVNRYLPSMFSLDRLESDVGNLYKLYENRAKILIEEEIQTPEQIKNWKQLNDELSVIIKRISLEIINIEKSLIEVIAYVRLLGKQKKWSIFTLLAMLHWDIYPRIRTSDIEEQIKLLKVEYVKKLETLKNPKYTLRTSRQKDAEFLFKVKIEAMKPTSLILRTEPFNYEKEFRAYVQKFEPEKIQVIQSDGNDIGRLRVVRSPESIYIGAIQILPEFQGKGIGTAIIQDIIKESESSKIPVALEVHHINERAISFYKKLGFEEIGKTEKQILMKYIPK